MKMMAHLVVLRHGKSEINQWNDEHPTEKKIWGQLESPLTLKGEVDATEAGRQIAQMPWIDIKLAVSSNLWRALKTTFLVLEQLPKGIPMRIISRLREINYGQFAGRREAEIQQKYPEFFPDCKWKGDFDQKAPSGENYRDLDKRLKKGMDPLLADTTGDILIVSHQHTLRVFFHQLFGLTREQTYELDIPNAQPIVIKRGNPNILVGEVTLQKLLLHQK